MSLRWVLRQGIGPDLERLNGLFRKLDVSRLRDYALYLTIQARAVFALEYSADAAKVAKILPDWRARCRSEALAADLAELGLETPAFDRIAGIADPMTALGAVYWLEATRAGGRLLLLRVAAGEEPRSKQATAFLRHDAEGRLAASFSEHMQSIDVGEQQELAALRGARFAFAAYQQAVAETLNPERQRRSDVA